MKTTKGYVGEEKRGGKVYLFARFDYTDPNGVRRSIKRRVKTRTEGNRLLPKMILKAQESGATSLDADKMTVHQFLQDHWLPLAKQRLSRRSHHDYESVILRYIKHSAVGKAHLSKLKHIQIQSLYSDMLGRGLSAGTVRFTHAVLSQSLKHALKLNMIRTNPATLVQLPKHVKREMQSFSLDESKQFLAAAESDKYGLVFLVALHSGMRPEEYLALRWSDVDFANNRITVQRIVSYIRDGDGFYFDTPKTPKSRRSIPLPGSVMAKLGEHRKAQLEHRLKRGAAYHNDDLIFATDKGAPLELHNLRLRHFKPILKRAGLSESFRLYDLRHACATLLLLAGENPKIVSERLGHASIVMTLDTYSHVLPGMQQGATDSLDRMLALG